MEARARRRHGWISLAGLLASLIGGASGCFDSDEKIAAATTGDETTGGTTTGSSTSSGSSTSGDASSTTEVGGTCRDAVQCALGCAAAAGQAEGEADLSCFSECAEMLTVDEAVKLLELAYCASERCEMSGICSSGTSSSDSGGSTGTTGGSSSEDGGDDGVIPPCLSCVFGLVQDPQPPGCEELAAACE